MKTVTVPNVNRFEKIVSIELNRKALDYQLILIKKRVGIGIKKIDFARSKCNLY